MNSLMAEDRIFWGKPPLFDKVPRLKVFNGTPTQVIPKNIIDCVESTRSAQNHLDKLLGQKGLFDNPKPVNLIMHLIEISRMPSDAVILDFFAGSGTPFDFRTRREVKNGFYDHCFVLNGEKSAELYEPECGRIMRVMTDMPAVQFYAGGATGTRNGKNGAVYGKNSALCLETQFYPDAPNRPDFPTTVLKTNEIYSHRTVYEFSTDKSVTTIRVDEYAFCVDVEKTREYYKNHALCDCANCRNFYAQVRGKLPKLDEFLTQFGVDISHPDEIWSVETDDGIDYISADYTVCGRVEEMGKYEIDLHDEQFLSVIVTNGFTSPNEQTGEYFTLSVNNISLPWGLDEPIPEPIKATAPSKLKRFFGKIFG